MVATEVSVTTIFFNSLWGQSSLFFQAILSVGKPVKEAAPQRA
jgi:P-type Cu+ transporter